MVCPNCHSNQTGKKYCTQCGYLLTEETIEKRMLTDKNISANQISRKGMFVRFFGGLIASLAITAYVIWQLWKG